MRVVEKEARVQEQEECGEGGKRRHYVNTSCKYQALNGYLNQGFYIIHCDHLYAKMLMQFKYHWIGSHQICQQNNLTINAYIF